MQPLLAPPSFDLGFDPAARQLPGTMPFQVQHRRDCHLHLTFHRFETLAAILVEPQRALHLFEKQFDLPPQRVQFDDLTHAHSGGARHQDLDVVGCRFF